MTRQIEAEADRIAALFYPNRFVSWEGLRGYIEREFARDLDHDQIDILTDLVEERIGHDPRTLPK